MNAKRYNIVMIDNYDSFVYNLADEILCLGHELVVFRNDVCLTTIQQAVKRHPNTILVISPGPGAPSEAGNLLDIIKTLRRQVPMLGICLGHQAMVEALGGIVGPAGETIHGKTSPLYHDYSGPFRNVPQGIKVARYHSLSALSIPQEFQVIARCGTIPMSVYSEQENMLGLQFHPESLLTTYGSYILKQTFEVLLKQAQISRHENVY